MGHLLIGLTTLPYELYKHYFDKALNTERKNYDCAETHVLKSYSFIVIHLKKHHSSKQHMFWLL